MLKVLLVVVLIAMVVWVLVRLALRRIDGGGGSQARPPRVVGPDDDPDFLRGLDRRRRDPEDD
ncbi:hypothetical protein [Nocardioides okcheonensis]|uniref:hypothetical protein n=1 Tax=Nocardioides okcheonensis TaxID=2894081 RepID=UPI001E4A39B8|nr:hypothetical protein [Nocardioides okcheonensis]UFN43544.1 hypothetical protein LN652_16050 [Nocardioides okcheonensis]